MAKKLNNLNYAVPTSITNDNLVSSISQAEGMAAPLWGGHLGKGANDLSKKLISTFSHDRRLYAITINSLKAQLKMQVKRQIVPELAAKKLTETLDAIKKEIAEGKFHYEEAESIYDCITRRVAQLAKNEATWLNVANSTASQQAGDLKVWVRDAYDSLDAAVQNLQAALIDKAEENVKTIFPGNSNSQLTQPVSFGHHLLAYVEMFARDRSRIKDARKRMNESPYVSGDIAGTSFHTSRDMVARTLSFDKSCSNSIDAINSRDYVIEFLSTAVNCANHTSKIASEMLEWHGSQNNYINFSENFVAQSQIVPYKRDARILEAIRSKSAKISGYLMAAINLDNSLHTEFSQDYNEFTEPAFDAYDNLLNATKGLASAVADFTINRKKLKEAASHSFSTAIDLVNWLIQSAGSTPEKAQQTSRKIIEYAIAKNKKLSLLEVSELQKFEPKINDEVYSVLIPSRALITRRSGNGSNPVQIRKAIRAARRNYL
ncbi:MAG: argininosuccinate lyase [Rickettsiales bacterium]